MAAVPDRAKDPQRTTDYQHPYGVVDAHENCPTCAAWDDADAAKREWRDR